MGNKTVMWQVLLGSLTAASLMIVVPLVANAEEPPSSALSTAALDADIKALIEKAVAARDRAIASIPSARGSGSYHVTIIDENMKVVRQERASFQMARSGPREFVQFRYEDGAGHEAPDVYARVVLTNGKTLYESRFCQRIRPTGAEATATESVEPGTLQPLVSISGNLADYYSYIHLFLNQKDAELAMRDEEGIAVVTSTDEPHKVAQEFWIDPRQDFPMMRYRIVIDTADGPLAITDVQKQWKHADDLWYVTRCVVRNKHRKEGEVYQTEEAELVFDTFEPNVDVPDEVFSIDALGLPEGSRILWGELGERQTRYARDPKFDLSSVEKVVGELPKALPPR